VILLDEPTSGLDPVQVVHMRKLIDNLRGRATILISSHVLTEIHALCDRIVVLDEGRVIAQGTEAELATGGQGSMHVVLEVQGDAEALQRLLISLPYVRAAGTPEPLAAHLRLDVELSHDARDQLCAALVQANVGVLTLARQPVALEQTFLRLMGQRASGDPEERPS
jgi:ABC-2 type transport system ATP-binding protein